MRWLHIALYAEGRTDERFLPAIVQRTAANLPGLGADEAVDIAPVRTVDGGIDAQLPRRAERILEAARRARNHHILVIHADADDRSPAAALDERVRPGALLVEAARQRAEAVCDASLPIVPVRAVEAWMLADPKAIAQVVGCRVAREALELPSNPRLAETIARPKERLAQVVSRCRGRRGRPLALGELYEPLGAQVSLERLGRVPAYRRFAADLTEALRGLGFIRAG